MKQKIFYINGLKFKHLKRRGFWWLCWFGILGIFRIISTTKDETQNELISYGTDGAIKKYLDRGFTARCAGWIFWKPIIVYTKNET